MSYQILISMSATELEKLVNRAYDTGWIAQGGVAVVFDGDRECFYQAMVKE